MVVFGLIKWFRALMGWERPTDVIYPVEMLEQGTKLIDTSLDTASVTGNVGKVIAIETSDLKGYNLNRIPYRYYIIKDTGDLVLYTSVTSDVSEERSNSLFKEMREVKVITNVNAELKVGDTIRFEYSNGIVLFREKCDFSITNDAIREYETNKAKSVMELTRVQVERTGDVSESVLEAEFVAKPNLNYRDSLYLGKTFNIRCMFSGSELRRIFRDITVVDKSGSMTKLSYTDRFGDVKFDIIAMRGDMSRLDEYVKIRENVQHVLSVERHLEKLKRELVNYLLSTHGRDSNLVYKLSSDLDVEIFRWKKRLRVSLEDVYKVHGFATEQDLIHTRSMDVSEFYNFVKDKLSMVVPYENMAHVCRKSVEYYALIEKNMENILACNFLYDHDVFDQDVIGELLRSRQVSRDSMMIDMDADVVTFIKSVESDPKLMKNVMIEDLVASYHLSVSGGSYRVDELVDMLKELVEEERCKIEDVALRDVKSEVDKTLDTISLMRGQLKV